MANSRILFIHPTGNPNSREAALALSTANILSEIITTVAYDRNTSWWQYVNFLPEKVRTLVKNELGRRTWITPSGVAIKTHPWREVVRVALMRTGLARRLGLSPHSLADWIYVSLDRHVAHHHLQGIDAVYAYEDGAAATFQAAKQQGILCLYDLPILFYRMSRDIQTQEAELFPELATALQGVREPAWKIERKEQEVQLADHIFVASSITKKSLLDFGVAPSKISVIPYGAPIDYFQPKPKTDKQFRAIYVGRVEPRKGIHYLLSAWQSLRLPNSELCAIGINGFPTEWLAQYRDIFRYVPSVPHASLNEYYSAANVLVFPSLVEGFGLVILEAMACGIPVITTTNTAGPDIISDSVEGFIIPIRDVEALKEKLEWCYRHPVELAEMGRAARRKAEQLTWELYRQKLAASLLCLLES